MVSFTERSNRQHSADVDEALALQASAGTLCALEYLKTRSVVPDVIARVLLQPQRRRQSPGAEVMHKY